MPEAYVIEVAGEAVGAVFREKIGYRFISFIPSHFPLNRRIFRSVAQAENSAARLLPPRGRVTRAA
jgi:hypothetical protein